MQHFLGLIKTKLTKNAHKGSMLCIVQLGRSINIQRLAFTTISNLINGESSIQLCVDELVSSLGLTIFTIIWNSANGGSSIQLLVDELAKSRLRLSPLDMWLLQLSFQNLYAPWHQVQELLMKVSLRSLSSSTTSISPNRCSHCSISICAPQLIRRCCRCLRLSLAEQSHHHLSDLPL